jgi:micrococcal nuclease
MIAEGHAWGYDGGTKAKDFNILKEIRIAKGTWKEV